MLGSPAHVDQTVTFAEEQPHYLARRSPRPAAGRRRHGRRAALADRRGHAAARVQHPAVRDRPAALRGPQARSTSLNVYDDGSRQDLSGTLSSTTLSGFGMSTTPLDLTSLLNGQPAPFGEPNVVPRRDPAYGTISRRPDHRATVRQTAAGVGKTTIEVLNILLGQGNDTLGRSPARSSREPTRHATTSSPSESRRSTARITHRPGRRQRAARRSPAPSTVTASERSPAPTTSPGPRPDSPSVSRSTCRAAAAGTFTITG